MKFELNNFHIICFFFSSWLALFLPTSYYLFSLPPLFLYLLTIGSLILFFSNHQFSKIGAIIIFGFCISLLSIYFSAKNPNNQIDYQFTNRLVPVSGTVLNIPKYKLTKNNSLRTKFMFLTSQIENQSIKKKIQISSYDLVEIKPGEKWQFLAYLRNPYKEGKKSKYRQNYQNSLLARGVDLISYEAKKALKLEKNGISRRVSQISFIRQIRIYIEKIRFEFLTRLNSLSSDKKIIINNSAYKNKSPKDREVDLVSRDKATPIIEALMIGYRGNLKKEHWNLFNNFGISHLVAVSGLHISLFVLFVFSLIRVIYFIFPQFTQRLALYKIQSIFSLIVVLFYLLITGLSLPALRASIMASILLISYLQRKKVFTWRNYFLALFFVVLVNPFSLLTASFWFSFYAVFLIFLIIRLRLSQLQKFFITPFVLALGLYPVQLFFFGSLSLIAPVANLILIPLFSLILMPLIVLLLISIIFQHPSAIFLYQLASQIIEFSFTHLAQLPNFLIKFKQFDLSLLMIFILTTLLFLIPKGLIDRKLILFLFVLIIASLSQFI